MQNLIHRKEYPVHVYETGPDEKLNPVSFFNYLQDVAAEHAVMLGFGRDDMLKNNTFWVLSRISAEIREWPDMFEKVIVSTWPAGTDRMFAVRNFSVSYPDGREIASAKSSWLIVDLATRRIRRPGEEFNRFKANLPSGNEPEKFAGKIEPENNFSSKTEPFRVKMSDLDVNMHTNNTSYIKWVIDTYDEEFIKNHRPVCFLINFLSESRYGNLIEVRTAVKDGLNFYHSVAMAGTDTELCRIITGWEKSTR